MGYHTMLDIVRHSFLPISLVKYMGSSGSPILADMKMLTGTEYQIEDTGIAQEE